MRVQRDICHCRWHWLSETIASLRKDGENVPSCSQGSVPGVIVMQEGTFQVSGESRARDRLGSSRPIHQLLASLPLGRTYILSQGWSELYSYPAVHTSSWREAVCVEFWGFACLQLIHQPPLYSGKVLQLSLGSRSSLCRCDMICGGAKHRASIFFTWVICWVMGPWHKPSQHVHAKPTPVLCFEDPRNKAFQFWTGNCMRDWTRLQPSGGSIWAEPTENKEEPRGETLQSQWNTAQRGAHDA